MKFFYIAFISLLLFQTAQAQFTLIPDSNFEQALIDEGIDDVPDGQVLTAEIEDVTELYLSDKGIQDLTGIHDFSSISELWVDENQLSSIDVSQNATLQFLIIDLNPIASIDISSNTNLVGFAADFTNLSTLNTFNNPNLQFLYLWGCNITSLDLSNNPGLMELDLDENNLAELDLSNNANLSLLYCEDNFNLSFINLKNGNTEGLVDFFAFGIAANACIQVDDAQAATDATTFPYNQWNTDPSTTFSEACSLSSSEFELSQIKVYPNPTTDKLTVSNTTMVSYQIYDAKGSLVVAQLKLDPDPIDVSFLTQGMYFLKFTNAEMQSQSIRFVKK